MSLPMGAIMYVATAESFGVLAAAALGIIFATAFFLIIKKELLRLVGSQIQSEIESVISENGGFENFIEIQRIRQGIIARVYLYNARDYVSPVYRSIVGRLDVCGYKKYLWVMQVTDIPGEGALPAAREKLNRQLLRELLGERRTGEDC